MKQSVLTKAFYMTDESRNSEPIFKDPMLLFFLKMCNPCDIFLPKQTHEISFHLEAVLHQNLELGTFYHCHNLERFLPRLSVPSHRRSVGKDSCSGEKWAGQGCLMTKKYFKHE